MHPLLAFAGTYGPGLASWLLANADELGDAAARLTRPALAALTEPTASLDRIGSALVSQRHGQIEVIGLLHQHTTRLDRISTAVDEIGQSIDGLGHSVGLLTTLSMVGLGVSILSQVHLAFQFDRLTRRINAVDRRVRAVQDLLVQEHRAKLAHGLDDLRNAGDVAAADPQAGRQFTFDARLNLAGSRSSYTQQLSDQLANPANVDPLYLWMLARHLTTAALGEVACHLRLNQPDQAAGILRSATGVLTTHASAVFNRTVAPNPNRFLMPATAEYGVTLDAVAELYRQAAHAGVAADTPPATAADLFESLRGRWGGASDPLFGKARKVRQLRAEFAEASAAVEEVNRLKGLALAIERYEHAGRTYLALSDQIVNQIAARRPEDGACFAVFPHVDR